MEVRNRLAALAAVLFAGLSAAGQGLPKGQVVEKVVTRSNAEQSYALYLPSKYDPRKLWPILYCFDPGARGRVAVERFVAPAEKYGYIVVGSNNSRNGPTAPIQTAIQAVMGDAQGRFSIDSRRVYAAGFSGGANIATVVGMSGVLAGAIACAGGFRGSELPGSLPFALYATVGVDDFAYSYVQQMGRQLEQVGATSHVEVFAGGHDWAPPAVAMQAIEWMELQAMKSELREKDQAFLDEVFQSRMAAVGKLPEAEAARGYAALAHDFRGLRDVRDTEKRAEELQAAKSFKQFQKQEEELAKRQAETEAAIWDLWKSGHAARCRSRLADLRKQGDAAEDSDGRRVARRVLAGMRIRAWEESAEPAARKDYARAVSLMELAAAVQPNWVNAYYEMARLRASMGDKKAAIEALGQAVQYGFKNAERLAGEAAFESLRQEAGFAAILEKLRQGASEAPAK